MTTTVTIRPHASVGDTNTLVCVHRVLQGELVKMVSIFRLCCQRGDTAIAINVRKIFYYFLFILFLFKNLIEMKYCVQFCNNHHTQCSS